MADPTQSKQLAEFIKQHYAKSYNRKALEKVLDKSLEKKQTQFEKAFAAELEKASKRSDSFNSFAQAMEQSNRKVIEQIRLTRGSLAARAEKERQRGLIMFKKDLVDLQSKTKGMDPTKAAKEVRDYIAKQTAATEAFEEHLAEKRRDIEKVGEYLAKPATALKDAAAAMIRRGEEKGSVIMRRLGGALSFAMDPTKFAKEWAGKKGKQFAFAALMKTSSKFRARIAKKELERKLRDPAFMLKVTSQVIREVRDNKEKQTDAMASLTKATLAAFDGLKNAQKASSDMQEVDATMREEHSETLKALLEMLSEENKDEKKKDAELEKEESGFVASMENTINDKMSFFTNHLLASLAEKLGINALKGIVRGLPKLISGAVTTALMNPAVLVALAAATLVYLRNAGEEERKKKIEEDRVAAEDRAKAQADEIVGKGSADEAVQILKDEADKKTAETKSSTDATRKEFENTVKDDGVAKSFMTGLGKFVVGIIEESQLNAAGEDMRTLVENTAALKAALLDTVNYLNKNKEEQNNIKKFGMQGFGAKSYRAPRDEDIKKFHGDLSHEDIKNIKDEYIDIVKILSHNAEILNLLETATKDKKNIDINKVMKEIAEANIKHIKETTKPFTTGEISNILVDQIKEQLLPQVEPTKEYTVPTVSAPALSYVSPGVKEILIKKETEALNVDKLSNKLNILNKTMKALPKKTQQIGVQK